MLLICQDSDSSVIRGMQHVGEGHFNNLTNEPPTRATIDSVAEVLPLNVQPSLALLTQEEEESLLMIMSAE